MDCEDRLTEIQKRINGCRHKYNCDCDDIAYLLEQAKELEQQNERLMTLRDETIHKLKMELEKANEPNERLMTVMTGALQILKKITVGMNLKQDEDPEWEECGRWISLGKAVEEIDVWKIECQHCHHFVDFYLKNRIESHLNEQKTRS